MNGNGLHEDIDTEALSLLSATTVKSQARLRVVRISLHEQKKRLET